MSRQEAHSLLISADAEAELNEIQAGIFENLAKYGNSFKFKSHNANLEQKQGSYEFKRFANATVNDYGTARTAGTGTKVKAPAITVKVNKKKEIVEEVNGFDVDTFGLDTGVLKMAERRKKAYESKLHTTLETDFWGSTYKSALKGAGIFTGGFNSASGAGTIDEQIEAAILQLETLTNDYVQGVERSVIGCVCKPSIYSKLKSRLNTMYNANFTIADEELHGINGVAVFSELRLPKGVDFIITVQEVTAQPAFPGNFKVQEIPLSDDYALSMFPNYGTECLAPDLVVAGITLPDTTHVKIKKVSALPTTANTTAVPTDTIFVLTADTTSYNSADDIAYNNAPAGTMWTGAVASSTITWTRVNA